MRRFNTSDANTGLQSLVLVFDFLFEGMGAYRLGGLPRGIQSFELSLKMASFKFVTDMDMVHGDCSRMPATIVFKKLGCLAFSQSLRPKPLATSSKRD